VKVVRGPNQVSTHELCQDDISCQAFHLQSTTTSADERYFSSHRVSRKRRQSCKRWSGQERKWDLGTQDFTEGKNDGTEAPAALKDDNASEAVAVNKVLNGQKESAAAAAMRGKVKDLMSPMLHAVVLRKIQTSVQNIESSYECSRWGFINVYQGQLWYR
jgi:hypothetical protein